MDENLKIKDVFVEEELKTSYLSYAMSVIIGRALPDLRDGLKPVHRRIIYAMYKEGLFSNKKYTKSAGVVGEVLKKYHPHGDSSVYDAMVRLAQDWNMRYKLVDGQGNFGSIDGDNAAAYRYTEVKLAKISEWFLKDIEKETVRMRANFDNTTQEPTVLPTRIPNLLINGSSGIAVGMATNIPPHNITEVIDATIRLIENPNLTVEELIRENIIKGPDFPTGAMILKNEELYNMYKYGKGSVVIKSVCEVEDDDRGKSRIIIKEIPYQVNKVSLIEQIVNLVKNGKIKDISDIRDESNKKGIRVVIEVKRNADPYIILNQLYKFTNLKTKFSVKFLAIDRGIPRIVNLKDYLLNFIQFRKEIIINRTKFDLRKSEERLHIVEGLKKALENIDDIIKLIKGSSSTVEAKEKLKAKYEFSDIQAQSILDMRLQKLTNLEKNKLLEEYENLLKTIDELNDILKKDSRQYSIIKEELEEVKKLFGDERKTKLIDDEENINIEDLIQDEKFVIMITQNNYIKKVPLDTYKSQRRGGKGINIHIKSEDMIKDLFIANSKDNILIFTNNGNIHWLKTYDVPTFNMQSKGRPIINYIDLSGREITNVINVSELKSGYLIFLTKKGIIKKTEVKNFSRPRKGGIKAINLKEGDSLLSVIYSESGNEDIVIESNVGMVIRFKQSDLAVLGRNAAGVKAIRLKDNEKVVGIELVKPGKTLLTITEKGFGKRTIFAEYPVIKRAGRGVIDIKTDERNSFVVTMKAVGNEDEVLIISQKGKIIRIATNDIRIIGRNTKGVKVVNLENDDKVINVEKIINEDNLEKQNGE